MSILQLDCSDSVETLKQTTIQKDHKKVLNRKQKNILELQIEFDHIKFRPRKKNY